jgi:hypothetical protein
VEVEPKIETQVQDEQNESNITSNSCKPDINNRFLKKTTDFLNYDKTNAF